MSIRTLLVSAGLLGIVCGAAHAEPPPVPPPSELLKGSAIPPHPMSVELLLLDLEQLRAQKAELEKQEKALIAKLRDRLQEQAGRLQKLGVPLPEAKELEPDRVGRIIIEGNTRSPDRKILDKCDFRPGQILQYPKLEAARAALEKAGFRGVTVEAIPDEIGSPFIDIRVRVNESKR